MYHNFIQVLILQLLCLVENPTLNIHPYPITNASVNLTILLLIRPTANNGLILFNSFSNIDLSVFICLLLMGLWNLDMTMALAVSQS